MGKEHKELLRRIKSLEQMLGAKYVPDSDDGYDEHVTGDYGFMHDAMKKLYDKKKRYPWKY